MIFAIAVVARLTPERTGLMQPDVADARKSAIAPAIAGDFSRSTMRHCAGPGRPMGLLFHQLQQGTRALGLRRFRLLRSFRWRLIRQHRIA
jgi:hypothetical protein